MQQENMRPNINMEINDNFSDERYQKKKFDFKQLKKIDQ